MKKSRFILSVIIVLMTVTSANAGNYQDMEPMKLETPEMKPELVEVPANPFTSPETNYTGTNTQSMDFRFFKQVTNPGVKPYKFMDDLTFVGIPIFAAGWIIKGEKASFRQDYNNTHTNTHLKLQDGH